MVTLLKMSKVSSRPFLLLDYTKSNSICRCGKLCKTMAYGKVK
ncbi:Uncharacterised protein [Vibrio cholerae]|nr:Uncharacterised protein [Vibrio cholerae]CSC61878.1 Uncharacterised protein [Vibrio cholerae]